MRTPTSTARRSRRKSPLSTKRPARRTTGSAGWSGFRAGQRADSWPLAAGDLLGPAVIGLAGRGAFDALDQTEMARQLVAGEMGSAMGLQVRQRRRLGAVRG